MPRTPLPTETLSEVAAPATVSATLVIESEAGRLALLARAEKSLRAGEVLVQVKDLVGRRRSFETRPASPQAELVATEPARVLRGGLTQLVSYWRVPANQLDAVESHFEEGAFSHSYDVKLRVAAKPTPRALVAS